MSSVGAVGGMGARPMSVKSPIAKSNNSASVKTHLAQLPLFFYQLGDDGGIS